MDTSKNDCEHCEVAGRAEAIFWGGFMLGFGVGLGAFVMAMMLGWVVPSVR